VNSSKAQIILFSAFFSITAWSQSGLDSGPWPTQDHDSRRSNQSGLSGPASPGTPQLIYDAGSAILTELVITSDGKLVLGGCASQTVANQIVAIDATGKPVWPAPYTLIASNNESPMGFTVNASGRIYVAVHDCPDIPGSVPVHLYSILPNGTSAPNWPIGFNAMYEPPAIAADGTIYQMDELTTLSALRPSDGSAVWTTGFCCYGQGAIALDSAGNLYAAADGDYLGSSGLWSWTPSGALRWTRLSGTGGGEYDRLFNTTAISPADIIYVSSLSGTVYAFDTNGTLLPGWPFATGSAVPSDSQRDPLAVGGSGTVYIKTVSAVFAINPDGTQKWGYSPGGDGSVSPVVILDKDENAYFAFGNTVYSLTPSGNLRWSVPLNAPGRLYFGASGVLYVISAYQQLYAISDVAVTTGTINVSTNLAAATFTITGPATFSGSGTSATFNNAPVGTYTIAYVGVSKYITPPSQTVVVTPGQIVTFPEGAYTPITLSVCLTTSPQCSQTLTFSYQPRSGQALSQQITVSSNAPAIGFTATALTSGADGLWLSLTPSTGLTPTTFTITVASHLKPATYLGQIVIVSNDALNSTQILPVTLIVTNGAPTSNSNPVVLMIPGIFGTKLASDSGVVWLSNKTIYDTSLGLSDLQQLEYTAAGQAIAPLSVQALRNNQDYGGLFNLASDSGVLEYEIECNALTTNFFFTFGACRKDITVYNSLVETLNVNGIPYDVFPYDWREDIADLGEQLNQKINGLLAQYPGRPISLVAHSMGGLIVGEMLAKHGASPLISHIITMGTPFLGSVKSYFEFRAWDSFYPGIDATTSQMIGANWTAAYELLPQWPFIHLHSGAVPPVMSVYEGTYSALFPALPRSEGPNSALNLAADVWTSAQNLPPMPQAYAIVGTGQPTLSVLTDILSGGTCLQGIYGDGDAVVPLRSALGSSWVPSQNIGFVTEQHSWLPENPKVLRAVLDILGGRVPTTLSGTPGGVVPSTTHCEN